MLECLSSKLWDGSSLIFLFYSRSQWYKNPYIRGGYSNSSNMCDVSSRGPSDLAAPVWADVCYGNMPTECKVYAIVLCLG
jgi:hypothetical protein